MNISNLFWRASQEDLAKGFIVEEGKNICLFCGEVFDDKNPFAGEGKEDIHTHIEMTHGSVFVVLEEIADRLEKDRIYNEKEVNGILNKVNDDYVTVRRYLIEYGYLARTPDGSRYWRANKA